ncbi:PDIA6 [Cordylochernes scorpioides]|uniref:protein disulfide-isomerase n=1 Tax=Cordylochernes scorpioides TaxID=51811 RepID=A0ABY6K8Z9_9ARAC|nr:PDIA6 [Cordylochernes scorpioides]
MTKVLSNRAAEVVTCLVLAESTLTSLLVLAALCCQTGLALYDGSKDVILLNPSTFNDQVKNSNDLWILEFYAPCLDDVAGVGSVSSLLQNTPRLPRPSNRGCLFHPRFFCLFLVHVVQAMIIMGIAKVAAVDCDTHKSLAAQYKIQGFPTVMIFGADKNNPKDYTGDRNAASLVDTALKELRKIAEARLGGRKSSGGGEQWGQAVFGLLHVVQAMIIMVIFEVCANGIIVILNVQDVVELTESNFKSKVLGSSDIWLVEFYAPWCGHCKNLAPHWASAATELKGKVHLGAVDATVHKDLASQYNVRGYPTIKYFPAGSKSGEPEDYTGGRTTADIVAWAMSKVEANLPPPEVTQLTKPEDLTAACSDKQLCIISILPHLLDCQSACRNTYIATLQKVADNYKRNLWGWLWAEAMAQPGLEDSLEIGGFGYPAMAAVNARKMKYSILRGSFSYDGIKEFMREVAVGRGASAPIKGAKLPTITATEPWDGKDAEVSCAGLTTGRLHALLGVINITSL